MARKKWRITYPGTPDMDQPRSERAAYEFVDALRNAWVAGAPDATSTLTVQVDEGFGWEPHEHINFAEEGKAQ